MSKRLTLAEQLNSAQEQLQAQRDANSVLQRANLEFEQKNLNQAAIIDTLRQQLTGVPDLHKKIEELTKDRDQQKSSKDLHYNAANKAEAELEQAHAVLDGVDGAPPREYDGEYGKKSRNVVTRLAGAFLAIAQRGSKL